jgi:hypothetical protein
MITYHGSHRTPLKVGESGMPMVTNHVEDVLAEPAVHYSMSRGPSPGGRPGERPVGDTPVEIALSIRAQHRKGLLGC